MQSPRPYTTGTVARNIYTLKFSLDPSLRRIPAGDAVLDFRKLFNKRVDMVLEGRDLTRFILKQYFPKQAHLVEQVSLPLSSWVLHIMFSRRTPDAELLVEEFNRGWGAIRKNGTLEKTKNAYGR